MRSQNGTLFCIVISKPDKGFEVILEGGLLLWAKCIGDKVNDKGDLAPSICVREK